MRECGVGDAVRECGVGDRERERVWSWRQRA